MTASPYHLRDGKWRPTPEHQARLQRQFIAAATAQGDHTPACDADADASTPTRDQARAERIAYALRDVQPGDPQPGAREFRTALPVFAIAAIVIFLLRVYCP